MKNKAPIILNCFSRGGSNILWNIFLSHPDVCSPIQETLEIFRTDIRDMRYSGLKAVWLTKQLAFFNQWNLNPRRAISTKAQSYIDQILFAWKLKTLEDEEMKYKKEGELYKRKEVETSRLALKNNNGLIFLSEIFKEIYPDAVFFALVREPLSLYESHKRHNTPVSESPAAFARYYRDMLLKIQEDAQKWDSYYILHFEDLLSEPMKWINYIYSHARLDLDDVTKMRFKAKKHIQADGSHSTKFDVGHHYWFAFDEIENILEPNVNVFQKSRLSTEEIREITSLTADIYRSIKMEFSK